MEKDYGLICGMEIERKIMSFIKFYIVLCGEK